MCTACGAACQSLDALACCRRRATVSLLRKCLKTVYPLVLSSSRCSPSAMVCHSGACAITCSRTFAPSRSSARLAARRGALSRAHKVAYFY